MVASSQNRQVLADYFSEDRNLEVFTRLVEELYVGSQFEISRARGGLTEIVHMRARATSKVKVLHLLTLTVSALICVVCV